MHFPKRSDNLSISTSAAAALTNEQDDWKLVFSFAHYSGTYWNLLEPRERRALRMEADGFGSLRGYRGKGKETMLADWSHVRDSSPEAVARMAKWVRRWVERYTDPTA